MLQIRGIVRSKDELKETRCTLKRNRAEYEKETQPLSRLIMQVQESFTPSHKLWARRSNGTIRTRCKGKVLQIEMPAIAPEKDPTCTEKRMVSLFCEDRKTLWLAEEDTEWAMTYIQDQLKCNGCLGVADNGPWQGRPHPQP